jgi:hypothetical protein
VQWNRFCRAECSRFLNRQPRTFDLFEQPVAALGAGVGDAGGQEGVDLGPPGVDGDGQGERSWDLRVDAPRKEAVQAVVGRRASPPTRTVDSRVRSSSLAIQADRICALGSSAPIRFTSWQSFCPTSVPGDQQTAPVGPLRVDLAAATVMSSQVTRRRTLVSASSASLVSWKSSTTSLALGSSAGVRIAEA